MKKSITATGLLLVVLCATLSFGRVELETKNPDVNLGISSNAWMENGQFVLFFNKGSERSHQWISRSFLNLGMDAAIGDNVKVELGIEGRMWLNIPKGGGTGQAMYNHRLNSDFIIDRASGTYFFGDVEKPIVGVTFGRFPFKYNKSVRNLGEYLFRSGTYPAYLLNDFDRPFARVTGIKVSSDLPSKWDLQWHQDLLMTIETDIPPFNDISLTYLSDLTYGGFFNVGVGVQFAHLISVDENQTTPSVVQGSSNPTTRNLYVTADGDTGHYTFRGTKLMARASFDIPGLLRKVLAADLDFFGAEDMQIYSEAAVLGFESYPSNDTIREGVPYMNKKNPWGYDDLWKKIPRVIGINIPTFKILNVLAFEAEWFACDYPNNYFTQLGVGPGQSYPLPDYNQYFDYTTDNWKWSLYAKKMFAGDRLGIVAQIARDHIRTETLIDEASDLEQSLRSPQHYWWMMKALATF